MTDKDMQEMQDKQNKKTNKKLGRNHVEEYWSVKPITVDSKVETLYKSSENIKVDKFLPSSQTQKP